MRDREREEEEEEPVFVRKSVWYEEKKLEGGG